MITEVYARTGSTARDISLFLVEKGTKGFSLGQKIQAGLSLEASLAIFQLFVKWALLKKAFVQLSACGPWICRTSAVCGPQ